MSEKSNNPFQFWEELKRRKVVRVITVYAAAAFVVIELINNITEPLNLPEWVPTLVIVLLAIGFLIAIAMSWVFDITPEGIQKTKPATQIRSEAKNPASKGWKIATFISVLVIIAFVIFSIIGYSKKSSDIPELEKSIAILPFTNLSEERGNEYFADGLVEDLLNRISLIKELKVISRTSSEMYRERGVKSVPEIAGELGVSYILEGSVQRYGNKARITVQLINAISDAHIWAENYDRDIVDVFKTQSEIALQIASELNTILTSKQKNQIQENKTQNVKAFELYQMGRFFWNKRSEEGYQKSIEYYEKAIALDSTYGLAYAGLADTYFVMTYHGGMDEKEGRDKAVEMAFKALELDKNLAEAYTVLASVYDFMDWEWEKAERAFQSAMELNSNFATAHQYYAEHLSIIGKHEEARKHIDRAIELDPLSFMIRLVSSSLYYRRGRYKETLAEVRKCKDLQKDYRWYADREMESYWQLGEDEKAFEVFRKYYTGPEKYDLETAEGIYNKSGFKALLYWKLKNDLKDTEREYDDYSIASTYGLLGEDEKAIEYLEKAYISHTISPTVSYNIHFKNLHNNPRYLAILKKMGLEG